VISEFDVKKALNALHEQFFEEQTKQMNLFISGVGNVGKSLLDQIKQQKKYIRSTFNINLKVVAMSNSKTMVFDDNGPHQLGITLKRRTTHNTDGLF
jgi:aspartokinase/homoserine dehydrogenase 1